MAEIIPQQVLQAFELLINNFGNRVKFLGIHKGVKYYHYQFPEDYDTGFPNVVAYGNGVIQHIRDFEAIKIVSLFNLED